MVQKQIEIINKLGLHARAATKFARTAAQFSCKIEISINDKTIDAKSIMSLMLLAAAKGSTINICSEGCDEEAALNALETLINNRFDEEE